MLVISFNSYKGGACRTTTCYNTLPYLAEKLGATAKEPILVFDVDLDSMGLTSLFIGGQSKSTPKKKYSARHLFVDDDARINDRLDDGLDSIEEDKWYFENFVKVGKHLGLADDGSVLFCGADANADVISDAQFKLMKERMPIKKLISALKGMKPKPKAVVFDCASGVQLSTLNVITSIDRSVMCMRPTTQFRIGTRDYLMNKIPTKLEGTANQKREIILLPTAVSPILVDKSKAGYQEEENELKALRAEVYDRIEEDIVNDILVEISRGTLQKFKLNVDMVDIAGDVVGIPEIQRFKWTESELLHNRKDKMSAQEKLLEERYIMLADILAKEI